MSRATSVLGGFQIGMVVATFFFGVCTVQTTLYFVRFRKDPLLTRVLVMVLWPLQGAQIVLMASTFYRDIWTPPASSPDELWTDRLWPALAVVISGLVQAFYAWRIYRLCRSWCFTVTLNALILLKFVVGFIYVLWVNEVTLVVRKERWLGIGVKADDAVVDLLIALSMTYSLVKRRTRFASTNMVINYLVGYAVGTGLVTSLLSIVAMISFIIFGYNMISTMLGTMITCVYFFAMLANLHTRSTLKKFLGHVDDVPIRLTIFEVQSSPARNWNEAASSVIRERESGCKNPLSASNGDIS